VYLSSKEHTHRQLKYFKALIRIVVGKLFPGKLRKFDYGIF